MNFLENLALVGTAATILGVFLTIYGIFNNKTLKKESWLTREMIKEMDEHMAVVSKENRELMAGVSKENRELMAGVSKEIAGLIKENSQYLGNLIVAEGDKTRKTIVSD